MKDLFNKLIISIILYLPKQIIKIFAYKYVAGEKTKDALKVINKLNRKGFSVTIDILGEHITNKETAKTISHDYQRLLANIHEQQLDCNLSIKPSHLGMDINHDCAMNNILQIVNKAKEHDNFVRIDMEDSSQTNSTINLYEKLKENHDNIGIVFQAYLHRTEADLKAHSNINNFNFRLCKGIYKESPHVAIQDKNDINENFLKLLRYAFENDIYVGIATHDLTLIEKTYELINELKISIKKFEFQVLYGVPMSGWLEKHLLNNYKVRVYVPFGKDWHDYSMRRLKENPNIAGHVLRDIFRK